MVDVFPKVQIDIKAKTGLKLSETFGFKLFTGAVGTLGVLSAGLIRSILQAECGDSRVPQLLLLLLATSLCRLYI